MSGCCRCRRRPTTGGRGCACLLAGAFLAAAAVVAFLESSTTGGVTYVSDGWFHECAKWDAEGGRFLVSTFFGGGVAEVAPSSGGEEKVVVADPEAAEGRVALGIAVDEPRRRLLVVYAGRPPRFGLAAVGAYELGSWSRLFFTRLDAPGDEASFADDVAVDEDGNAYVTDAKGNRIWKLGPDGKLLSTIRNGTFFQRKGLLHNFVALNGIVYHPNGYLLAIHTAGGHLFKINPNTEHVGVVKVRGSLLRGDGLELLSPTNLAVAGMPSRLVESSDDWETANVTGRYVGPVHRIGSSATVKDGDVYINHIVGFGFTKKTHVIAKAIFSPLEIN